MWKWSVTLKVLKPPAKGFFAPIANAPVQGVLIGDTLEVRCANGFIVQVVGKPEITQLIGQKAAGRLGYPVKISVVDMTAKPSSNQNLEKLLSFGRAHEGVVNIKNDQ